MTRSKTPVNHFRKADDREELARLKRLTGLDWERVPESLLGERNATAGDPETRVEDRGTPRSRPLAG